MSIEAIKHYEAALLEAFPRGATGDVFEHWNKARIAIEEAEKQEPVGLAFLCNKCNAPFDRYYSCQSCGHNSATQKPVYVKPQPKREPLKYTVIAKCCKCGNAETYDLTITEAAHGIKDKNT